MSPVGKTPTVVVGTPPRPAPSLFPLTPLAPLAPLPTPKPLSIESRLCLDLADALRRDAPDVPQIWAALCGAMSSRGGLGHPLLSSAPPTPEIKLPQDDTPATAAATTAPRKNLKPKPLHENKPSPAPATTTTTTSKRERSILERFDPTPAWCNACNKEHQFDEFLRAGQGMRFMCIHDKTSEAATLQQAFFRRLMKDEWFRADRHSWETVGKIIRSAIDRKLDPECDLQISEDDTDAAEFV